MNPTRLMLENAHDLFLPVSDKCMNLKNKSCNTFLLYFGLPNSPITASNDDNILISESELEIVESNSDELTSSGSENNISKETVYPTFFSQLLHKFSIFNNLPFEELQSEIFLDTCEEYLSLIDKFNSAIFTPIKNDVTGNINKLRGKMNQNVMKFQTLYAIVNDEMESQTTTARNSATDALLWLKRAFEFLSSYLHEFGMGDKTLVDAVSKAYQQTLRRYHGLLARGVFSLALRAVPNNEDFIRSLSIDVNDASETRFKNQVFSEMLDHASNMSSVMQKITSFYLEHGLESTKVTT